MKPQRPELLLVYQLFALLQYIHYINIQTCDNTINVHNQIQMSHSLHFSRHYMTTQSFPFEIVTWRVASSPCTPHCSSRGVQSLVVPLSMEPELLADHLGMHTSLTLKRSFFQLTRLGAYNTSEGITICQDMTT